MSKIIIYVQATRYGDNDSQFLLYETINLLILSYRLTNLKRK